MYTNQIKRYLSKIPKLIWLFLIAYLFIYLCCAFVLWDILWITCLKKSDGFIRGFVLVMFIFINYTILIFYNDTY